MMPGTLSQERLLLENFFRDEMGIYRHPDAQVVKYSDGEEVERRVYESLRQATDLTTLSEQLEAHITDWTTEYHFSRFRHNLLRHLRFTQDEHILELGAGCGALTRQFGEMGLAVTAIEGSAMRARCAAVRCRDLSNVNVFCGDFQQVNLKATFDVVTLIGVLEYAPVYFEAEEPLLKCLKLAKESLRPGGRLILAIENRLGLKYFCGFPEDHLGLRYAGIEDRYGPNTVKTLGRRELELLLTEAGFPYVEFQYPFPDYKLPKYILTERGLTSPHFAPEEIIQHLQSRDYSGQYRSLFSEALAWPAIARNGLTRDMSNSFLVIASDAQQVCTDEELLCVGYTINRALPYNTRTEFLEMEEEIIVRKSRLIAVATADDGILRHRVSTERYRKGTNLASEINRSISQNDFRTFIGLLTSWVEYLKTNGLATPYPNVSDSIIRSDFFDCIPQNIIITKDGFIYVDREWEIDYPCSLGTLVLRYLLNFMTVHEDFLDRHLRGKGTVVLKLYERMGLKMNGAILDNFLLIVNEINRLIQPHLGTVSASSILGRHQPRYYLKRALRSSKIKVARRLQIRMNKLGVN